MRQQLWSSPPARAWFGGVALAIVTAGAPAHALTDLHLNEIRSVALPGPQERFILAQVELYNASATSASAGGLMLLNAAGVPIASLPAWSVPPSGFLTVVFGTGTDDSNLLDGAGTYYTQADSTGIFDEDRDECALYDGSLVATSLADYVAWSRTGAYAGGFSAAAAVSQNLWTANDFVDAAAHGLLSTMGLAPDGYDHDTPSDWVEFDWGTFFVGGAGNTIQNAVQTFPVHGALLDQAQPDLTWQAIAGADSFLVQVDDDSTFATPAVNVDTTVTTYTVTNALPDGGYFWRVQVYRGGVLVPEHARWIFLKLWGYSIPKPGFGALPRNAATVAGFTPLIQHKDSRLLCIYNPRAGVRPGCTSAAGAQGPWDNAHAITAAHVPGCRHCNMYCTRASIAMVNNKYGGTLTQDRIAYDLFPGAEAGLGHNQGTGLAQRTATYHWAMGLAANSITRTAGKPTFATVKAEINAGRPVYVDGRDHATVCWGYADIPLPFFGPIQLVLIANPWPGTPSVFFYGTWQPDGSGWGSGGYFTLPAMGVAARAQEASVTTDTDGDGIMDFDEENRLCSSKSKTDTDLDQLDDRIEVSSYTFHSQQHAHNTNAVGFSDVDGDNLRTECDCDSDDDADYDGGEDVNGDGVNPQAGETDVYRATSSNLTITVTQSACGPGQFLPAPAGGTLRGGQIFEADISQQQPCAPPAAGAALGMVGLVSTAANGTINDFELPCSAPGSYRLIIDAIPNGKYDPGCDPVVCFTIQAPVPVGLDDFVLVSAGRDVRLSWRLAPGLQGSLTGVRVERADAEAGPWTAVTPQALVPQSSMQYQDFGVETGREYWYRLVLEPQSGDEIVTAAARVTVMGPVQQTALYAPVAAAAAAPFEIRYSLAAGVKSAELAIFDVAGRRVHTLARGQHGAGLFTAQWDRRDHSGSRVGRGVYFVRLAADERAWTQKLVIARD